MDKNKPHSYCYTEVGVVTQCSLDFSELLGHVNPNDNDLGRLSGMVPGERILISGGPDGIYVSCTTANCMSDTCAETVVAFELV